MSKINNLVSHCCSDSFAISGGYKGTHYGYLCDRCGNPTEPIPRDSPPPEESTLREEVGYIYDNPRDPEYCLDDLISEAAIEQIIQLIQERERLARIDELNNLPKYNNPRYGIANKIQVSKEWLRKRKLELKGKQAVKVKVVTK